MFDSLFACDVLFPTRLMHFFQSVLFQNKEYLYRNCVSKFLCRNLSLFVSSIFIFGLIYFQTLIFKLNLKPLLINCISSLSILKNHIFIFFIKQFNYLMLFITIKNKLSLCFNILYMYIII